MTQQSRHPAYPRIREMRLRQHISQETLAVYAGISRRTYAKYEKGQHAMPVEVLAAIADYFHVSLDYLVGRSDSCEKAAPDNAGIGHKVSPMP